MDEIDAEIKRRDARIARWLVLWHHLRQEALVAQNEALGLRRYKWEMARLGFMPGEVAEFGEEPDWDGVREHSAWRRRASLYNQSWIYAERLHSDGVRDLTGNCGCDSCEAWRADHGWWFSQEDWERKPLKRRIDLPSAEMLSERAIIAEVAEKNREDNKMMRGLYKLGRSRRSAP